MPYGLCDVDVGPGMAVGFDGDVISHVQYAVDAMGGDHYPRPEVEGSIRAAKTHGVRVILVGDEGVVRRELNQHDGWRELPEGEIVSFLVGEVGAHQIVNRTGEPVRMLAFSTSGAPDIVIRPDSGTIGAFERRPEGGGLYSHFRAEDAIDYFEGEQPP